MKRRSLRQLYEQISPYQDLLIFAVTLLSANAVWKLLIHGDENGFGDVTFCGWVVTPFFDVIADEVARAVYRLLSLTREGITLADNLIRFPEGHGTRIVWSCTPVKQAFIFLCLIATTRPYKGRAAWHKLWYIPLCWAILYGFNILRIYWIALIVEFHPEMFELLHTYIFKYVFYGVLFLLWLIYTYRLGRRDLLADPRATR